MTKAFKKGFAAVLSIMMVLCFMPSMAFADAAHTYKSHEWAKDYSSVTVTYQDGKTTKFDAERTINENNGLITADPQPKVIKSNTVGVPDTTEEVPAAVGNMNYYDFSGAKVLYNVLGTDMDINGKNVDYNQVYSTLDVNAVKISFAKPSGVKTKTQVAGKDVDLKLVDKTDIAANWTIVATPDKTFNDQPTADETVTISYKIKAIGEATGKEDAPKVINNNLSAVTFTVTGKAKVDKDVDKTDIEGNEKIYFDSIPEKQKDKDLAGVYSGETLTTKYDGETHKVVAEEFKGWTATLEVFNDATGEWEAKKEISVKDVQDNPEEFRLSYSNKSGVKTEAVDFAANLEPASAVYSFDDSKSDSPYKNSYQYKVYGTEYNVSDYVVVLPEDEKTDAKAVKANEKALMEYFAAAYEVKVDPSDNGIKDPSSFDMSIQKKRNTDDADKKFAELKKNIEVTATGEYAYLEINAKDDIFVTGDDVTVTEGTVPDLKFVVKDGSEKVLKDFDKSLLHFTTVGGQELNNLKPGIYSLVATADKYIVHVDGWNLIVKAKASKAKTSKAKTVKQNQTMSVETKDVKVKAKKKTKKNKVVAPIVKVSGVKGKLSFKKVTGGSKFSVNSKTGKVTVKKGTKKGTYKVKIKVSAAATKAYKATSMTVTTTIKVGK